jgi:hypothetical protein
VDELQKAIEQMKKTQAVHSVAKTEIVLKLEELKNPLQQAQVAVENNANFLAQEKTAKCKGGRIEFKISERI